MGQEKHEMETRTDSFPPSMCSRKIGLLYDP